MKQSIHFLPEHYTEWFSATTTFPKLPGWYECTGWRFSGYLHLYWCGQTWHYFGPHHQDPAFPAFGQHVTDSWRGLVTDRIKKNNTKLQHHDLTGQRFGILNALHLAYLTRKGAFWMCACDCGAKRVVQAKWLTSGNTGSCGCFRGKKSVIPMSRPWDRKPIQRGSTVHS